MANSMRCCFCLSEDSDEERVLRFFPFSDNKDKTIKRYIIAHENCLMARMLFSSENNSLGLDLGFRPDIWGCSEISGAGEFYFLISKWRNISKEPRR